MKTKTLFYLLFAFGLILTVSLMWLITSFIFGYYFGYIGTLVLILSLFITGWVGLEYGNKYRNNPDQFTDDIKEMFHLKK